MENNNVTATLLISCPDRKGLVAGISNFIFQNNGNIIHADQHTDAEKNIFLQRVEWELKGFKITRNKIAEKFRPIAKQLGLAHWEIRFSDYVPRMAIFVSNQAHCMYDLLSRQQMNDFKVEIPLIVSNHQDLRHIADDFGIEFQHCPITPKTKIAQEKRILEKLKEKRIDLIVLARYMQILSSNFIKNYPNKIINIHHSFLPAFAGSKPYHQAHEKGVKVIGATAHYVTAKLDNGPIIEQDVVRASHRDDVRDLIKKGKDLEKVVLARAVDLHLSNRILVYANKTVVFD